MATRFDPSLFREPPEPAAETLACDACGKPIAGEPSGRGLYVWTRGDEVRYEEPPLCEQCANAIGLAALASYELEEGDD